MKTINKILLLAVVGLSSCASEAPFSSERENGKNKYGEFHKSALTFDVREDENVHVQTRATKVNIDDFQLTFYRDGVVEQTLDYKDMPEVMLLEQGKYTVKANYGDSRIMAAWDSPCYEGETEEEFEVTAKSITTSIAPIKCYLKNVKVSVAWDPDLVNAASDDSYILVKVNKNSDYGLKFYKNSELQKANGGGEIGYFQINEEHTLVATFIGQIFDADVTQETKSLDNVEGGTFYKMTFSLHSNNSANNGDAEGEVNIDGSVEYENMETNVTITDKLVDDDERPKEDDPGIEDPGNDDPVTPPSTEGGPVVTAREPINLAEWNVATDGLQCVLDVHSDTGITGFTVKIKSDTLTDEVLTGVGLASEFDLIKCVTSSGVGVKEGLEDLGLPVADQVKGQKDVVFDVSQFMGLLGIYGAADHRFILTITDMSGTTVKELKLKTI